MKRWLRRSAEGAAVAKEREQVPVARHQGLHLELDQQLVVLGCGGDLALALADGPGCVGQPLSGLLAHPVAWQVEDLPALEGQVLDLVFRRREAGRLYVRGWLERGASGWRLSLLDVGGAVVRQQQLDLRLGVLTFAGQCSKRLRTSLVGEPWPLVGEFLEGLALRLSLPAVGLLLARGEGRVWRLAEGFTLPEWKALLDERMLQAAVLGQTGEVPLALPASRASPSLWLVPFRERDGVSAWLACYTVGPARGMTLTVEDWLQVAAALAAPVLERQREVAREEVVERNRLLQEMLGSGWWEYHQQSGLWQLAPALAGMLGVAGGDFAQWLERVHPAERDEFRVRLADAMEREADFGLCLRLQIDAHWRWFRMSFAVRGRGARCRVTGFAVDIDDIKASEAQAAAATSRLESLVDSAPALIYVQRCDAGALWPEFYSASLESVLGWTLAEVQEQTLLALVHSDDRDGYLERTRRLLHEGKVSCHYRLRDRRGGFRWMLDEAKLLRDDCGQPLEVVGLCLDVSEAREANERLLSSEERYRLLVEDSPAMICRYRPDLTLSFANRPLLEYLGCTAGELGSVDLGCYLSEEQRGALVQRLQSLSPQNPVGTAEICLQLPGNKHAWWLWAERGVFDAEGRLMEVQAVARDDTELHHSRQQLYQSAKMATLGEMATGIAHEINQPLNVMRMALVNLLKRLESDLLTDDYLRAKLERIEGQVLRAARIVEHMRAFGRRSDVESQHFQPARAVDGALSLLEDELEKCAIHLDVVVDELPEIKGHVDQLEQVLINLLVNARDVLGERCAREAEFRPCIELRAGVDAGRVLIKVEDNAGGIEPSLLARVFEPFFTTKPVGQGTGLGLSVSYGIVRQMGGTLSVRNGSRGACFSIELPVDLA